MFRAPSLQHEYTLVFSGDPALSLPEDEKEREQALTVARETGNWDLLLKQGEAPSLFHVRQIPQSACRWFGGEVQRRSLQPGEMTVLALRLALRKVENCGGIKVKHMTIDEQSLATVETIDALFQLPGDLEVGRALVDELGSIALQHASEGLPPKR